MTGPTGDFPLGKLNEHDEGGLNIAMGPDNGCVRIEFGMPTAWIALPPDQALAFASLIVKHAMALKAAT
jgi:hypothetical protein